MNRLLGALVLLLSVAVSAQGHFIFILPTEERSRKARVVFSDNLKPDKAKLLEKISHTKFSARVDGKDFALKPAKGKDCLELEATGKGPVWVVGVCPYGVVARGGKEPFLLTYYSKAIVERQIPAPPSAEFLEQRFSSLELDLTPLLGGKEGPQLRVMMKGKPLADAEVTLYVPGKDEPVEKKSDKSGLVKLPPAAKDGLYGVRAMHTVTKTGKLGEKSYSSLRAYATLTFPALAESKSSARLPRRISLRTAKEEKKLEADPAATRLLADARAERANWVDFPGFHADVTVNVEGKIHKGTVEVTSKGRVDVKLDGDEKTETRSMLSSIVGHRLDDTTTLTTPCAFADDVTDHPLGRAIKVLNDEFHSSYRIRDKQVIVVNRSMKDLRFTITVLENRLNAEKKYLPASYIVNYWDVKSGKLRKSVLHFPQHLDTGRQVRSARRGGDLRHRRGRQAGQPLDQAVGARSEQVIRHRPGVPAANAWPVGSLPLGRPGRCRGDPCPVRPSNPEFLTQFPNVVLSWRQDRVNQVADRRALRVQSNLFVRQTGQFLGNVSQAQPGELIADFCSDKSIRVSHPARIVKPFHRERQNMTVLLDGRLDLLPFLQPPFFGSAGSVSPGPVIEERSRQAVVGKQIFREAGNSFQRPLSDHSINRLRILPGGGLADRFLPVAAEARGEDAEEFLVLCDTVREGDHNRCTSLHAHAKPAAWMGGKPSQPGELDHPPGEQRQSQPFQPGDAVTVTVPIGKPIGIVTRLPFAVKPACEVLPPPTLCRWSR